jgi:deoxyadenosine/deoxycytidine kinase
MLLPVSMQFLLLSMPSLLARVLYKMMSDVRSDVGLFDSSVDGIMWLTTEPEECERRIRNRGRDGEQDISIYLYSIWNNVQFTIDNGYVPI